MQSKAGSSDAFIGAWQKLEQARHHLDELRRETRVFTDALPYIYRTERDSKTGEFVVRIRVQAQRELIPRRLSLIAGDAIHNIRSGLDHAVWDLAGAKAGPHTQFPVFDSEPDYRRNAPRMLAGVGRRQRACIRTLQPFRVRQALDTEAAIDERDPRAANVYLMGVARLDNMDKHRVLLAAGGVIAFRQPTFSGATRVSGTYKSAYIPIEDGAEVFRITHVEPARGATEMNIETGPVFTILFGDQTFETETLWANRAKGAMSTADISLALGHAERILTALGRH